MSTTLGAATKLLDEMITNYSQWHTERAPSGKKVNSIEEISSLSDKVDMIMAMLATNQSTIDPNNVPLASLIAQEKDQVDVNFLNRSSTILLIEIILVVTTISLILPIMATLMVIRMVILIILIRMCPLILKMF